MDKVQEWKRAQEAKAKEAAMLQENGAFDNVADYMEYICDLYKEAPAIVSVDRPHLHLTYQQLDQAANQIAAFAIETLLLKPKDVVALMMENRPEYPAFTLGFAKAGVTVACINFNLKGKLLLHALAIANVKACVVSTSCWAHFRTLDILLVDEKSTWRMQDCSSWLYRHQEDRVLTDPEAETSFISVNNWPELVLNGQQVRPPKSLRASIQPRDSFLYIYTSGTTGPSKAAKFSHRRWIGCGITWRGPSLLAKQTSYYIPLPLYHGNGGAVALSSIFLSGCRAVVREKFSASQFMRDICQFECRYMIYVGEIWRYIYSQPEQPNDSQSPLKVIVGNGLRSDIWSNVVKRFGLERVVEHYGSTEMPGDAILQWFGRPGSCGFIPPDVVHSYAGVIIRYDIEMDQPLKLKESSPSGGWSIRCEPGEAGELVMALPEGKYDGYVGQEQTAKKLYRNVFEKDDLWFSTGDLLRYDNDGFFYFIDRAGDSFRWKGENVSTSEVADLLSKYEYVLEANVYGVKVEHTDGKAGMLSLTVKPLFNLKAFAEYVSANLPAYARPVFVRLRQDENEKTSTFKFQKSKYVLESFDLEHCSPDDVYVWQRQGDGGTYIQLDKSIMSSIQQGQYRF